MKAFRYFAIILVTSIAFLPLDTDVLFASKCLKCSTEGGEICCPS